MHKNDCYAKLVNTIKKMEVDGISIKTKSGTKNVRFIMGLLLGDNLGLNNILGFSKSFSANHYCRFCLVKKSDAQAQYAENTHMLRNRMNYTVCTDREDSLEIGISSECVFNNVPSFHCTENFAVDIMHDVFEGVCHHVLCKSLLYFMKIMRFFNIDTLNNRISHFVYEDNDKGNEKHAITYKELESSRLKLSARQMMSFCHYFTVLFGELIPNSDVVWNFLLNFFELIDDMLCYQVSEPLIIQIKTKIEKLNQDYQILFKKTLTPKFHFLLHYPLIIKQCGPLRNLWSFKFEGKHKEFKIYSHVITSRKNIPKSFAFKQQMAFVNYLHENSKKDEFHFKKPLLNSETKIKISNDLKIPVENFSIFLEADIWGFRYNKNKIITKFVNDFEQYKICAIIFTSSKDIIFYTNKIITTFNTHFAAFEYITTERTYTAINFSDLIGPPVEYSKTAQGKTFIKIKEYYKNCYIN